MRIRVQRVISKGEIIRTQSRVEARARPLASASATCGNDFVPVILRLDFVFYGILGGGVISFIFYQTEWPSGV